MLPAIPRRFGERDSTAGSTVQVDTACHEPVRDLDEIIQTAKPMREFELRGWSACVGADDATYFYHRATQIVTDMDLRSSSALSLLFDMMDVTCVVRPPPDGWELWIQMLPSTASDVPTQCHWIHHETRWISRTCPEDDDSERCSGLSKTERLEMDIRYWSYVEAHPSHESAYLRTVSSAINLLTRCHAELILSTPDRTAPPFTLDECQKLTDMINSLGSGILCILSPVFGKPTQHV
ncbi:hypothetical protein OF83DRAFT_1111938 [Amylostereum chailletii]|nr:hypothetical protein OF83DRAFT_1111938 [Amylostereum chailletii]